MALELLIRDGVIVTMDPQRRVLRGDVLVRGRDIVAVGPAAEVQRARRGAARVLEADGCAVVPGLVQAHVHLCQALFRGMADELPLLPWLRERIWPLEAAHDAASLRASARLGIAEMLLSGTTSVLDMGTVHEHDEVFEAMRESGIRGTSGKTMMDSGDGLPSRLHERTRHSLDESERLCRTWHGAEDGRLRYAFAPRFILSCSEGLMRDTVALAKEHAALLHTHVAEHAAERAAVRELLGRDDVEALADCGIAGPNAVLAHGVQLRDEEMRQMAASGTRLVHCPSANLKLASGIARVRSLRDAGLVVGVGADGAPCNNRMDPWTELRQAALLGKARAGDAAAVEALAALEMATIDGARVLGIDHEVGSLEPGKRADVAVVRLDGVHAEPGGDAVSRLVYACTAADVQHVVVDGQLVVCDRELRTLDAEHVRAEARSEAARVLQRASLGA